MSRIRGFNTTIELAVRRAVSKAGLRYRKHVMTMPGRPDLVFAKARLIVFIDGDFWHGYRYPQWRDRLSSYWQEKIERNRRRDRRNFARLRREGWRVLRLWEHEIERDLDRCVKRILDLVEAKER
jgi:DNA mismatch endonuclease, patch repair protein